MPSIIYCRKCRSYHSKNYDCKPVISAKATIAKVTLEPEEEVTEEVEQIVSLGELKMNELRKLADKYHIDYYGVRKKLDLIELIKAKHKE